jgi:Bax protein
LKRKLVALVLPFLLSLVLLALPGKRVNSYTQTPQVVPVVREAKSDFPSYSHISLKGLPIKERKEKFIRMMVPLIERANREVLEERAFLLKIREKGALTEEEKRRLKELKEKYRADSIKELLKRVNSVPVGLILAQGAVESGWGTSRFFTEANNVFGIYSYGGDKCLKAKDSSVCLKVYDDLYQSVKDYIYNLNVGWAYERFRELRSKGADIYTLIESLHGYSERKDEYTELVKEVVRSNGFDSMFQPELASSSPGLK